MEKNKIIVKITEPTEWVNALVLVEKPKNRKLRVCLDPRPLNKAIQRPHYPLPTLKDVTTKLTCVRYFSVLGARSVSWPVKLSAESSMLTMFNTVFVRHVDEMYEGLDSIAAIVDDILVFGKTKQKQDQHLQARLDRTRDRGVRLNSDKFQFSV